MLHRASGFSPSVWLTNSLHYDQNIFIEPSYETIDTVISQKEGAFNALLNISMKIPLKRNKVEGNYNLQHLVKATQAL